MNKMQQQVAEFHYLFRLPVKDKVELPSQDRLELRARLIEEETKETCDALRNKDVIGTADGLADLCYVVFGAALELGIDLQKVFDEVHASNLTKAWKEHELSSIREDCVYEQMDTNCYVVRDQYGKVIKSPNYSRANINKTLETDCG